MPVRFANLLPSPCFGRSLTESYASRRPVYDHRKPLRPLPLLAFAILSVLTVGCGEPNPLGRRPIKGGVTFQGKPIDYGTIQFAPADPQHGVSSGTMIENGTYAMQISNGLPPGSYAVMISAPDRGKLEKVEGPPGDERTLAVERIPTKYNLKTTLKLEVPTGRGQHTANFELE